VVILGDIYTSSFLLEKFPYRDILEKML